MFKLHSLYLVSALGLSSSACQPLSSRPYDKTHPPPGSGAGTPLQASTSESTTPTTPSAVLTHHSVIQGSSFYQSLKQNGVSSPTILAWVKSAEKLFPVRDIVAGTDYTISWDSAEQSSPIKLVLKYAADSSLVIERQGPDLEWTASKISLPVSFARKTFHGVVGSTLWESAEIVGMDPSLINSLAEVFAWQIDFNRAVKRGDRWRLTVEQKSVENKVIGWGNILAAEYENDGQLYTGIRFPAEGAVASYYAPNGQSLKRMFLKSPIKFGRITSGFSQSRFHPILRENRPHNGVDYGAPMGTPVMAVGRGEVISLGYSPANGNMIKLRHNGNYQTAYVHLQRFAPGLRRGAIVEQGQFIGNVGATGLATGPHLHFAFYVNGIYADPMGLKFPSAEPIAKKDLPQFQSMVASVLRTLPAWQFAQQSPTRAPSDLGPLTSSEERPLMH